MKNLLVAFLAVGIVACSSSTDPNEEEPEPEPGETVVGAFQLNEDNTVATWIGKQNAKAKVSDTLVYELPDSNSLEIFHSGTIEETGEERIDLTYADSTINQDTVDQYNLAIPNNVGYHFEGVEIGPKPYKLNVKTSEVFDNYIESRLQFQYTCGNGQDVEQIGFDYNSEIENPDGQNTYELYKSVRVETAGFHTVVDSVFCGE